jgi:protein O-mannosyl-transferase
MSSKKSKAYRSEALPRTEPAQAAAQSQSGATRGRRWIWLLLPVLLALTLAAYYPAWHGGMLWDDDGHITPSGLRTAAGLARIWLDVRATQQYYPVVHSAFWLQHRLWGNDMLGYHLVNIVLHSISAFLIALILQRLSVPGAWLAAMIFALHPVNVESVAWVSELKNTLSGVLYLGAALVYLRYDDARQKGPYACALLLFVSALLSKSVTATLPAALLVVFWWLRGRVDWRRDVRPLVPFFALGVGAGLFTLHVERTLIGAQGAEFQFTLVERILIAGRAIWFYLGKLFMPVNLSFIYPRWQISQDQWWLYPYPLGVLLLLAGLWLARNRSRAPLAALLLFCGTLFPALGFFNVYPFQFSFVADHFQYLAGIAVIALFSASLAQLVQRLNVHSKLAAAVLVILMGASLGIPAWSQSRLYADAETLYRATINRNPSCWMAYNNLGILKADARGQEAIADFEKALQLKPGNPEIHNNLGSTLRVMGRLEDAAYHLQEALRADPAYFEARYNLGLTLQSLGRPDALAHLEMAVRLKSDSATARNSLGNAFRSLGRAEDARIQYEYALRLEPDSPETHCSLGVILQEMGQPGAMSHFAEAVRLKPDFAEAHNNLGNILQEMDRLEEAATHYREALRIKSDFADACYNLGNVLQKMGRLEEAVTQYRNALALKRDYAEANNSLGLALQATGRPDEAMTCFREAVRLKSDYADAYYNLGNLLLGMGRLEEAVRQYREALRNKPDDADACNNLGTAFEGLGRFAEAVAQYTEALRLNPGSPQAQANLARVSALVRKRSWLIMQAPAVAIFSVSQCNPEDQEGTTNGKEACDRDTSMGRAPTSSPSA